MSGFESLTINCQDRYQLSARYYPAAAPSPLDSTASAKPLKIPVLTCPATGITSNFYHHYNSYLQSRGHNVLCFDFRGIGASLNGHVKHSTASIVQWGQLDLPAAIDKLAELNSSSGGGGGIALLGHSAGGQLLGVAPNHSKVSRVVAVAGSSGNVKGLRGRTAILAPLMFNAIFPISRRVLGYGPTKAIGMGENLPKDVAAEWAEFCNNGGYMTHAVKKGAVAQSEDFHGDISCPITSIYAVDDEIATDFTVDDFLRTYPKAATRRVVLNPKDHGHSQIGHMSMFKRSHSNLWPVIEREINGGH